MADFVREYIEPNSIQEAVYVGVVAGLLAKQIEKALAFVEDWMNDTGTHWLNILEHKIMTSLGYRPTRQTARRIKQVNSTPAPQPTADDLAALIEDGMLDDLIYKRIEAGMFDRAVMKRFEGVMLDNLIERLRGGMLDDMIVERIDSLGASWRTTTT